MGQKRLSNTQLRSYSEAELFSGGEYISKLVLSNKLSPVLQSFPLFCGQFYTEPGPVAGLLDMSVVSWQVRPGGWSLLGVLTNLSTGCQVISRGAPIPLLMVSYPPTA